MARVLIVDDEKSIRVTLQAFLAEAGHAVCVAEDADTAEALLSRDAFDVVVSDIVLPRRNGMDLLRAIRAAAPHVQVVMMTGEPTVETAAETVRAGAADYLCKPIGKNAILRVVGNAAKVKALDDERRRLESINREHVAQLECQNAELHRAAQFREEVERITRHDLKSPLNVVIAMPEVMLRAGGIDADQSDRLRIIQDAGRKMLNMINLSLDIFRMEQGMYKLQPQPVDLLAVLKEVVSHQEPLAKTLQVLCVIQCEAPQSDPVGQFTISGERLLCYSMLGNLVKNAIEASPKGATVRIDLAASRGREVRIRNRGAVPPSIRDRFFGKYVTCGKTHGVGLGTYSARLMAAAQGGAVRLDCSEEDATTIVVSFPEPTGALVAERRG
jgi:DNA-binding response OmpR family regulator